MNRRDVLLLRTKLSPPRPHRRVLPHPAHAAKLREAVAVHHGGRSHRAQWPSSPLARVPRGAVSRGC